MRLPRIAIVSISLAFVSPSFGTGNEVTVFNQPDCKQWLELTSNGKKKWLLGFLSGLNHGYAFNHKGHDPLSSVKSDRDIFIWMNAYCTENPTMDISDGGVALFRELKGR